MGESVVKIIEQKTTTEFVIIGPMAIQQIDELRIGLLELLEAYDLVKKVHVPSPT